MNSFINDFFGMWLFTYIFLNFPGQPVAIAIAYLIAIVLSKATLNPILDIIKVMTGVMPASEIMPRIISLLAGGLAGLELYKRMKIRF